MSSKIANIMLIGLIFSALAVCFWAYPAMPERLASHWDLSGNVNGTMPKAAALFLFPGIMAFLLALYFVIPAIDPLHNNIAAFREAYNLFWVVVFVFMLYIFGLMIAWNLGVRFDLTRWIAPAFSALWYAMGDLMPKTRRNWFIGIRTPWTLHDDGVWERTHRFGGKLFKISAGLSLVAFAFGNAAAFVVIIVSAVFSSLASIAYSYIEYRKTVH